jgi:hypothetical protein
LSPLPALSLHWIVVICLGPVGLRGRRFTGKAESQPSSLSLGHCTQCPKRLWTFIPLWPTSKCHRKFLKKLHVLYLQTIFALFTSEKPFVTELDFLPCWIANRCYSPMICSLKDDSNQHSGLLSSGDSLAGHSASNWCLSTLFFSTLRHWIFSR